MPVQNASRFQGVALTHPPRFSAAATASTALAQSVLNRYTLQPALTYVYDGQAQKGSVGLRSNGELVLNISDFRHPALTAMENQWVQDAERTNQAKLTDFERGFLTSNYLELVLNPQSGQLTPRLAYLAYQVQPGVIPSADYTRAADDLMLSLLTNYQWDAGRKAIVKI